MSRYFLFTLFLITGISFTSVAQESTLNATYDAHTFKVSLYWNMVNYTGKATYSLTRSDDKINWTQIVTDKIFQRYNEKDTFDYIDKVKPGKEYFYRLSIINANNQTIAFSNTISVNIITQKTVWEIYPNPVNDLLNIACRGNTIIKGVVNVLIYDVAGKIVTRFRSASVYRSFQIPVTQLHQGIFIAEISILNEIVLKQQFIKR